MFGADLLVAPVLYDGALTQGVSASGNHLEGCLDRRVFQGGQVSTADAPLKHLPLYLRREKVLPIKA